MRQTITSQSNTLALDQVIARLSERKVVDGIIVIGSAAKGELTATSDYDLIVVLSEMPAPLHVALTYIDQRLTDVVFFPVTVIDRLLTQTMPLALDSEDGKLLRWMQTGHIAFDRSGHLRRLQNLTQMEERIEWASEGEKYSIWFSVNYNLRQTKRMLASADPAYLMMVDLRLLFSLHDLWVFYFQVRGLPHRGKEAIRHLAAHDPAYLELFGQCLSEKGREGKVRLYEQLMKQTVAPVGDLWEEGSTAIQFKPGAEWHPGWVGDALAFWEALIVGRE